MEKNTLDEGKHLDEGNLQIPYFVHEAEVARLERTIKRLFILCLVIFGALVVTNAGWILYESQFEDTVVTQDVDNGDGEAIVSGTGDINYGSDTADSQDAAPEDGR